MVVASERDGFRHEALLYAGESELVPAVASFVRDGLSRGEPALVVVSTRKLALLREELDGEDGVAFADMAAIGKNPARIIPAWREFVQAHAAPGATLRGVGEPIFPERSPEELVECQRHEDLLNLAFKDADGFWLLCPYDTSALDAAVVERAHANHAFISAGAVRTRSAHYRGLDALAAPFEAPLDAPPAEAAGLSFEKGTLAELRTFVAAEAANAGLDPVRRSELVLAVSEIASNSVRHGGGEGTVRVWRRNGNLVCEIRDAGRFDNPLADRELAPSDEPGGRGLWIANRLCDLVQIRTLAGGTAVRLHLAVPE